jgi:MscS family membrane protein
LGILILKKSASRNITKLIFYIFRKLGRKINEAEFFSLVLSPLENFIVFLTAFLACGSLNFPRAFKFRVLKIGSDQILEELATGVLIYLFFHTILRVIDYLAIIMEKKANQTQDFTDNQLIIFFREFLKVLVIIICILVIIRFVFNQDITKLLAGLSLAGAAIALAAKESLENLIASFIIFFDKPFSVGDLLKVQQVNGTVEKIGLRSTRIRTADKTFVTIPNKQMVDSIVDNISLRTKRRGEMQLQVELKATSTDLKIIIEEVKKRLQEFTTEDNAVLLSEIRPDSYVISIEYFTGMITISDFNEMKQEINLAVLQILENRGIGMAGKNKIIGTVN